MAEVIERTGLPTRTTSVTRYDAVLAGGTTYLQHPDHANIDVTGDITLVVEIAPNVWHPSADQVLLSKYTASPNLSYRLILMASGAIVFDYTTDGTTNVRRTSTAGLSALANGTWRWVASTFDLNNGSGQNDVRFWTSTDGVTWTQLGITVTNTGTVTAIASGTSVLTVGRGTSSLQGMVRRAQVRSGIGPNGTVGGVIKAEYVANGAPIAVDPYTGQNWTQGGAVTFNVWQQTTETTDISNYLDTMIYPYRRVDIYESDGTTVWMENVPIVSGSITVDYDRDERRQGDITIDGEFSGIKIDPLTGIWYDKIIKMYRGLWLDGDTAECWQVGEFMIDRISYAQDKTRNLNVSMRDMTKKMMNSKFSVATAFAAGTEIAAIIRSLASNSGIPTAKIEVPNTGKTTGKIFTFERGTSRWEVAKEITSAYGYELYFKSYGALYMREYVDPLLAETTLTLVADRLGESEDGVASNVATFEKSLSDARLYNHIVVTGESANVTAAFAEVKNTDTGSPTNIYRIGERTYTYTSQFIATDAQALDTANKFLKVHALEQFEVNVGMVVFPWIEVGTVLEFIEDRDSEYGPDRYLFKNFTIPMTLGDMSIAASRVSIVGDVT